MKAMRFGEEQIIPVLREAEAGVKTEELCRPHGILEAMDYNCKAKYAGMNEVSPVNVPSTGGPRYQETC